MQHFPLQVLSRIAAINDTVWPNGMECLNALCKVVPRATCYVRLLTYPLNKLYDMSLFVRDTKRKVEGNVVNRPIINQGGLQFIKENEQYVVTDPLPFELENTTIEAWIKVSESERVTNVARNKVVVADNHWKENYYGFFANDGNEDTYWSSQLGTKGVMEHYAMWSVDLNESRYSGSVDIYWKEPAADFYLEGSLDNITFTRITTVVDNEETDSHLKVFFQARWVNIVMTKAYTVRGPGPGHLRPVFSIFEVEINTDLNLARLKPTTTAFRWNRPKEAIIDGDFTTWWAMPPGTKAGWVLIDFGRLMTGISVVTIRWHYMPYKYTIYFGEEPCNNTMPSKRRSDGEPAELEILSGLSVTESWRNEDYWQGQCIGIKIAQVQENLGVPILALSEVQAFREDGNLASYAETNIFRADPGEGLDGTSPSHALDGNPDTYWLIQPIGENVLLSLDLGRAVRVISMEVRFATIEGTPYKASGFTVSAGPNTSVALTEYDRVDNYLFATRRFLVSQEIRFVELRVFAIFSTNPSGRLAIEDLIVHAESENFIQDASVNVSSAWTACETCYEEYDGFDRIHRAEFAVDGNESTWFGAPYGFETPGVVDVQILLDGPQDINLVVLRFRFPTSEVSAWCADKPTAAPRLVASILDNEAYLVPVRLTGTQRCEVVRVLLGTPLEKFGDQAVMGFREIELYSFDVDYARNKPAFTSDGSNPLNAVDIDAGSKWNSVGNNATNLTVDLTTTVTPWGIRVLFASGKIARAVTLLAGDSVETLRVIGYFSNNEEREIFLIKAFTASVVQVRLEAAQSEYFSIRAFQVLGSPNLALNRPVTAPYDWNHRGLEAVDGLDDTFFVSEPWSTEARVAVDLGRSYFITGGIFLVWKKDYQAEEFSIWTGPNMTTFVNGSNVSNLTLLKSWTGNEDLDTPCYDYFEGRYVEVRMTRPNPKNGDGVYALASFDVQFDPNLAHGKVAAVTHTKGPEDFIEHNSIDGDMRTIWVPEQHSERARVVFDLGDGYLLSGYDITWRMPPRDYALEALDPNGTWFEVARYTVGYFDKNVGVLQIYRDPPGISAMKLAIQIYEQEDFAMGRFAALREVLLHLPATFNIATGLWRDNDPEWSRVCDGCALIDGNQPDQAFDGNLRGTYWLPGYAVRSAWVQFTLPDANDAGDMMMVGRIVTWWRFPPDTWKIEITYDPPKFTQWETVYTGEGHITDRHLYASVAFLRPCKKVRITIIKTEIEIGLMDIGVYGYKSILPPNVENRTARWNTSAANAIDLDTRSYWMGPPFTPGVEFFVDLLKVYLVYDIYVWFGFRPTGIRLKISVDNVTWTERYVMGTKIVGRMRLQGVGLQFPCRYIMVFMGESYDDGELIFGSSIRDIGVYQFRNMARNETSWASNVWEYPESLITDGDEDTYWHSRFGAITSTLDLDIGRMTNIAGMRILFGYEPSVFQVYSSEDNITWVKEAVYRGNRQKLIEMTTTQIHFKARWVRLHMEEARWRIDNPDEPDNSKGMRVVMSVKEIDLWEHTGGGGVVGLQNLDGSVWDTLTYGLQQPGEWIVSSEMDKYTETLEGPVSDEDMEKVNQFVITFKRVQKIDERFRVMEMQLFRNGVSFGKAYTRISPFGRLQEPNQTRLVFGVRSSAHHNVSDYTWSRQPGQPDPRIGVKHGATHNPFFEGGVYNVTLIKNALSPEEVRGLYEASAVPGGQELACHCFDACPTGSNRFFPNVPVPCSGQGACVRSPTLEEGVGYCVCVQGFFGLACEEHCSQNSSVLTTWGCCQETDDCPSHTFCDTAKRACVQ
eukprot:TRINITY_DN34385_c0_g2_i1.p1 TRINITY_DN34385_c0_g2~~TRINITY_DN34385_c0_g2_i1.p1  ORF type:complete len:2103 (-),score=386.89 TRINITY_DN34385_c0_g2_i1:18-5387(-)